MKRQSGVSLIELIIFIIVFSILSSGILISFIVSLEKTPALERFSHLLVLAQERMELILGQREINGFNNIIDICSVTPPVPTICTVPSSYAIYGFSTTPVWSTIQNDPLDANRKEIDVFIEGFTNPILKAEVVNY